MPTILAFHGSPRKKGNTSLLLAKAVAGAMDAGAHVEEIHLHRLKISPCLEIYGCKKDGRCVIKDDFQTIYNQISSCDGIMIASPIFFYAVSAQVKMMMDRCQSFWVKKYWIDQQVYGQTKYRKKGLVISVGASKGKNLFDGLMLSMKAFFDAVDTELSDQLLYTGLDLEGDILQHPEYLTEAYETGKNFCNRLTSQTQ